MMITKINELNIVVEKTIIELSEKEMKFIAFLLKSNVLGNELLDRWIRWTKSVEKNSEPTP